MWKYIQSYRGIVCVNWVPLSIKGSLLFVKSVCGRSCSSFQRQNNFLLCVGYWTWSTIGKYNVSLIRKIISNITFGIISSSYAFQIGASTVLIQEYKEFFFHNYSLFQPNGRTYGREFLRSAATGYESLACKSKYKATKICHKEQNWRSELHSWDQLFWAL